MKYILDLGSDRRLHFMLDCDDELIPFRAGEFIQYSQYYPLQPPEPGVDLQKAESEFRRLVNRCPMFIPTVPQVARTNGSLRLRLNPYRHVRDIVITEMRGRYVFFEGNETPIQLRQRFVLWESDIPESFPEACLTVEDGMRYADWHPSKCTI